jgi:hypothetical protein
LQYFAAPAAKYGGYQFEDRILDFLRNKMTPSELKDLESLSALMEGDRSLIEKWLDQYNMRTNAEARLVYFTICLLGTGEEIGVINKEKTANERKTRQSLKVGVFVDYEIKDKRQLRIILTNNGEDLECGRYALPWGHWYSMTTLISQMEHGEVLRSTEYVDPLLEGAIILKKDEKIEGLIDLDARFPELVSLLFCDDVDLFWSYALHDMTGKRSERVGGWILLPKTDCYS